MEAGWREYRKIATVWARRMSGTFTVETLEGLAQGEAGDYLCRGIEGEEWPVRREKFENTYAPVSPGSREEWREYCQTGGTVRARQMPEAFTVQNSHGLLSGNAGDYLCEDADGVRWPVKASIFEVSYTPVN
jgi:hypothetical protein